MICGQKVVCIIDTPKLGYWPEGYPNRPVKGQIYIVRDVYMGRNFVNGVPEFNGEIGLRLVGLKNEIAPDGYERGFHENWFRLLEGAKLTKSEQEQFAEALFTS